MGLLSMMMNILLEARGTGRGVGRRQDRTRRGWLHFPSSPDSKFDDAPHTSEDLEGGDMDGDGDGDGGEADQDEKSYALRQRVKVNYTIPLPFNAGVLIYGICHVTRVRVPHNAGYHSGRNSLSGPTRCPTSYA